MREPRIGELFAGYGGLGLGVQAVLGGNVAWYSEIDKGALKILEHRFPGVLNVGDITKVDWSQVEPVDILTGGSPCQDLSHAGKRAGMTEGTRSNLWVAMREVIAQLRPGLVVWENVGGAFSATAVSEVEPCSGCLGDGGDESALRALHRVLGDLASLGFDADWVALRAADVGAPHGRLRVFVVAYPQGDARRIEYGDGATAANSSGLRRGQGWPAVTREAPQWGAPADAAGRSNAPLMCPRCGEALGGTTCPNCDGRLLPTPRATDGTKGGPNQRGSSGDLMLPSAVTHLLPTPAVNDMDEGKTVEQWDAWTARMKEAHGNGNGHGASLAIEAQRLTPETRRGCEPGAHATTGETSVSRLLPTPTSVDARASGGGYSGQTNVTLTDATVRQSEKWGQYVAAIARWESLTRPAPAPTQPSKKGTPQLSAAFSEWLMGLPAGWVTDVPDITRNEALRALGNGVVPQQAAAALRFLLAHMEAAA